MTDNRYIYFCICAFIYFIIQTFYFRWRIKSLDNKNEKINKKNEELYYKNRELNGKNLQLTDFNKTLRKLNENNLEKIKTLQLQHMKSTESFLEIVKAIMEKSK